ncbi:MAG: LOG family protein [Marivibrio sp.]|uniref:LOG family protein n=1 Tax=Marivibrio sp. TaxID=2039719 RepID=UPI0032EAE2D2
MIDDPSETRAPHGLAPNSHRLAFEDAAFLWRDEMRPMRLAAEFAKADLVLRDWKIRSTVVFFGSARLRPNPADCAPLPPGASRDATLPAALYEEARVFARRVAAYGEAAFETSGGAHRDYVVCTGGGPGLMEAANRGAAEAGAPTIGLNIDLPHEQAPNRWVTPGLSFRFQYFALRKMHFLLRTKALALFPGGFGTLDELFDALTLMQTGKIPKIPILMFGADYWRRVVDFDAMADAGTIDPADRDLMHWVADPQEAWEALAAHEGLERSAGAD